MRVPRMVAAVAVVLTAGAVWAFNAEDLLIDLNSRTGARQHEAALRLGDFNYPEVVKALSEKLDDKNVAGVVRAACAQSLGKLNDASTYAMIQTLAKDKTEKGIIRSSCVTAMVAMKKDEVIDELVTMLKTEEVRLVRTSLEEGLGGMEAKDRVATAVAPLLKDVKTAAPAIRVLGKVGGARVIAPLARELASPRSEIRLAVITALGDVERIEAGAPLLAYYPKAKDVAERGRILASLANHPHPQVVALMVSELTNPQTFEALRRRAALSLGLMKPPQAIMPLRTVMLKASEPKRLRLVCVQALGQYGPRDDLAIAGLIGALADEKLQKDAAISLNRITNRYFGTNQAKWNAWFQKWRHERDRRQIGH